MLTKGAYSSKVALVKEIELRMMAIFEKTKNTEVIVMPKNGIIKNNPFSSKKNRKEIVFKCLLNRFNDRGIGMTQQELVSLTGLSQPTVSRALKDLQTTTYHYGASKYKVISANGLYHVLKETDNKRREELYEEVIADIAQKKAFIANGACQINAGTISYSVKKASQNSMILAIHGFFKSSYIENICPHSYGIYIILKDGKSSKQRDELKDKLLEFYNSVVKKMEEDKQLRKMTATQSKDVLKK